MSTATQKKRGFKMSLILDYQYTEKYTKTGKLVKNWSVVNYEHWEKVKQAKKANLIKGRK